LDSSVFAFAVDVADEGPDMLAATAGDRAGVTGISLAVAYHHARDIFPHNPKRSVYFHEGGTVFFHPESERYGKIRPARGTLAADRDLLRELCTAGEKREMDTRAWTVYLHNSRLGSMHPDDAPRNALGDRFPTELCPARPEVRRYAVALTADIGRYPIRSIMAEALHFRTIEHGFHHERYFLDLGTVARFLLGVCFCDSCLDAGEAVGVDGDHVRRSVADQLREWLEAGSGGHGPADRDEIGQLASGEMAGYLRSRERTVTSLVADVQAAATATGIRLTFSAHGGSAKAGKTQSSDSTDTAWMLGVDVPEVATVVDEFEILGYATDTAAIDRTVTEYARVIGDRADIAVALRPMWPDTTSAAALTDRMQVAADRGASRVDFYHYGLMPTRSLDWIGTAVAAVGNR
jgi:hypothetical protein